MNVSEKLKAWDRALKPSPYEPRSAAQEDVAFWEIRNALPQIVAVVKAAETMRREYQDDMDSWSEREYDGKPWEGLAVDFDAALAALEETLGEVGIVRDSKLTDRFDWNSRDGVTFDAGQDDEALT